MAQNQIKQISKFLNLVMRHSPEKIEIEFDVEGWMDLNDLIPAMQEAEPNLDIDFDIIEFIVENANRSGLAFNEDKTKLRVVR